MATPLHATFGGGGGRKPTFVVRHGDPGYKGRAPNVTNQKRKRACPSRGAEERGCGGAAATPILPFGVVAIGAKCIFMNKQRVIPNTAKPWLREIGPAVNDFFVLSPHKKAPRFPCACSP